MVSFSHLLWVGYWQVFRVNRYWIRPRPLDLRWPRKPSKLKICLKPEADEIFTSATPFKVLPVGRIEDRVLENVPGPISLKLKQALDEICAGRDERFKNWLQPLE